MTMPHERMNAWARMNLLAALCQRRELELPDFVRHIARRAFRHGHGPESASLVGNPEHRAVLTEKFYWKHSDEWDAAFTALSEHYKARLAAKRRAAKKRRAAR